MKGGLYETRRTSWCIRGPTKPEEEVLDPPREIMALPLTLKIGNQLRREDKIIQDGEELGRTMSDERILGEYRVNIGGGEHDCRLARSTVTYEMRNGSSWKHIVDMYKGMDGVLVLQQRYSTGRWLERHGYANWEKGPSLEHKGVTYYMEPSESYYLAERYIPTINLGKIEDR